MRVLKSKTEVWRSNLVTGIWIENDKIDTKRDNKAGIGRDDKTSIKRDNKAGTR